MEYRPKTTIKEKFDKFVVKQRGCWDWSGHRDQHGYPRISHQDAGKRSELIASRVSYELYKGAIPDGMLVRHRCDNPACTNPKHLELGTRKQNSEDMVSRERSAAGSRHGCAKLDEVRVLKMREMSAAGNSDAVVSAAFGVSRATAQLIRQRRTWRHI